MATTKSKPRTNLSSSLIKLNKHQPKPSSSKAPQTKLPTSPQKALRPTADSTKTARSIPKVTPPNHRHTQNNNHAPPQSASPPPPAAPGRLIALTNTGLAIFALIVSLIFGIAVWIGQIYGNNYARQSYELSLWGLCADHESIQNDDTCRHSLQKGPGRLRRRSLAHLDHAGGRSAPYGMPSDDISRLTVAVDEIHALLQQLQQWMKIALVPKPPLLKRIAFHAITSVLAPWQQTENSIRRERTLPLTLLTFIIWLVITLLLLNNVAQDGTTSKALMALTVATILASISWTCLDLLTDYVIENTPSPTASWITIPSALFVGGVVYYGGWKCLEHKHTSLSMVISVVSTCGITYLSWRLFDLVVGKFGAVGVFLVVACPIECCHMVPEREERCGREGGEGYSGGWEPRGRSAFGAGRKEHEE